MFWSIRRQAKLGFSFLTYLAMVFLLSTSGSACSTVNLEKLQGSFGADIADPQNTGKGLKVKHASDQSS